MTIIERTSRDALIASINALSVEAAERLTRAWFDRAVNEVIAEVFRIAGLHDEAAELTRLTPHTMPPTEFEQLMRSFRQRAFDSALWSDRSHADCESLRCATRSTSLVGRQAVHLAALSDAHERASFAVFIPVYQALFVDRALVNREALEKAPSAQAALDKVRSDIAAGSQR